MIDITTEMTNILEERMSKHIEDDFGIQACWDKMIWILSQDERETIAFLQKCSEKELYWIGEIFEEVSENLNSRQFIKCLRELNKRYPDLNMTKDIDLAEDYVI